MNISIFWSDKLAVPSKNFARFLQMLANRYMAGHLRYGPPDKKKKYLTRLKLELKEYERKGNAENLKNVAVYCALELECPEHKNHHDDSTIDSVTRGLGYE